MQTWIELQKALIAMMVQFGLIHFRSGKTRDIFDLPNHKNLMLIIASDRISIFDIILNATIPFKGEVLTAITIMWTKVLDGIIPTHTVAYGAAIDEYLPAGLRGNIALQKRAVVVKKVHVFPYEAIVRGCLTGSGWQSYKNDGTVCGIKLPAGLHDGSFLAEPIFTPSTKAEAGEHDENIAADQMNLHEDERAYIKDTSLDIFKFMNSYARPRGLIMADTKYELSKDMLVDEYGTPDSSRIWSYAAWEAANELGVAPEGFDKQFIREWGIKVGIKKNPNLIPPPGVLIKTADLYLQATELLCDKPLEEFQTEDMGISKAA